MRKRLALNSVAAVLCIACGDSVTEPPPPAAPLPLYYLKTPTNSGDEQSDTALAVLANPFRVLVRRGDIPAPGITVLWQMAPDTLRGIPGLAVSTVTDAEGIASYTLTLGGAAPYTYAVRASLPGVFTPAPVVIARGLPCGSALCFTATAKPGKPTSLRMVSGDNQTDTTNAQLGADYIVQTTDRHGNAVAGVVIDWAVTAGGGSITPTQNTTMAPNGHAAARHTLGPEAGTHSATATASALPGAPQVTFTSIPLGSLQVSTRTSGVDADQNGYGVSIDFGTARMTSIGIGINATATINRLIPGEHAVLLNGVAMNCDPGTANPRTIMVPSGGTAELVFEVACAPAPMLAFIAAPQDVCCEIHTINMYETASTPLASGLDFTWSPDGAKIAFNRLDQGQNVGLYVMNADGSNQVQVSDSFAGQLDWSPDGTRFAFTRCRYAEGVPTDRGVCDVFVMNVDGTNIVNLTNNPAGDFAANPAWSPDGTKIAFEEDGSILIMNADGSNVRFVTAGAEPAWSPDGTKLAIGWGSIGIVNTDGSGLVWLTLSDYERAINPDWSPDGRLIAFARASCELVETFPFNQLTCSDVYNIAIIPADPANWWYECWRSVEGVCVPSGVVGVAPAWRP